MLWFAPSERGLALGIRQTAIPLGGLIVALVVPHLAASQGRGAFLFAALAALGGSSGCS
jgi:sugar phosphate permease